jgi:hypothetical protein
MKAGSKRLKKSKLKMKKKGNNHMALIQYLNERNYFLEKFCQLNETQFKLLQQGHVDGLDHFYNQRESVIGIIRNIDTKITKCLMEPNSQKLTGPDRDAVKKSMAIKDEYVQLIMAQDLDIIAYIDDLKTTIFNELKAVSAGKKLTSGYKPEI